MKPLAELERTLDRIDGCGYRAYKELQGSYGANNFVLHVDHVQGDPFAAPSRLRAVVPHSVSGIDQQLRLRKRRAAVHQRAADRARGP